MEVACPLLVESIPEISSPDCPKITTRIRTCVHFGGEFELKFCTCTDSKSPPKCTHVRILVVILGQSGLEISGIDSTRRGHATSTSGKSGFEESCKKIANHPTSISHIRVISHSFST